MTGTDAFFVPSVPLPVLPSQPAGTDWPTSAWPTGPLPASLDHQAFATLMDQAFAQPFPDTLGETHACVLIHRGRLVYERYAEGYGAHDTRPSWSMAKSITHALVGILVREGKIDIHAPADVPEWHKKEDDPRQAITLDHLLRMASGLRFREEYEPETPSDVIEMLWGKGKDDVARFATSFPLRGVPGKDWYYSSGASNIVARCTGRAAGLQGDGFETFMRRALFDVLGMKNVKPKFDKAGTFIGSSFCFARARDFAKFGLLYMRDGIWENRRVLPEGWVDYARSPTGQTRAAWEKDGPYGAHWWLGTGGPGSFSATGFEGQYTCIVPDHDLILVRHGRSPGEQAPRVRGWIRNIISCFRD